MSIHLGQPVEATCRKRQRTARDAGPADTPGLDAQSGAHAAPHRTPSNSTPAGFNRSRRYAHNHRYVNYGRVKLVQGFSHYPPALARHRPAKWRRSRPTRAPTPPVRGVNLVSATLTAAPLLASEGALESLPPRAARHRPRPTPFPPLPHRATNDWRLP